MKKLNRFQKAVANILNIPTVTSNPLLPSLIQRNIQSLGFNQGVTIYPYGKDETFINQGYNKNAWVYSIVSKCAKKFGQIPWYHYKVKTSERKTWAEYIQLTKESLSDGRALIEAKKMRKKAVEQVQVDDNDPLQKFLSNPNINQSRAAFMENLYGYKLLTGEGNIWMPRIDDNSKPTAMVIIPKNLLGLVRGATPWDIAQYKILFPTPLPQPRENIISWKFPNYNFDVFTLNHLRGQSPLDAGLLLMQSSNEGAERLIAMNKNQGVAGAVFDKSQGRGYPTPEQASLIRRQFNDIINDPDLAGQIGWLTGDLGYIQFGLDAGQLKLLEQSNVQFEGLCNIFDVPPGIFKHGTTYENKPAEKKDFIYDNIVPAAYGLRDELNAKLISAFNLDRDRDVIDCDILSLPDLSEDLKTQTEALEKVYGLSIDQRLEYLGFDPIGGDLGNMRLIPNNLTLFDDLNMPIGGDLTNEVNMLNNQ